MSRHAHTIFDMLLSRQDVYGASPCDSVSQIIFWHLRCLAGVAWQWCNLHTYLIQKSQSGDVPSHNRQTLMLTLHTIHRLHHHYSSGCYLDNHPDLLLITSAIFAEEPPLLSTFGVSIEIIIFDPFGVPTSCFAPRKL